MNINAINRLNPSRQQILAKGKGLRGTRLLVAGSADQLSYWKDWRDGNFDLALLGSWPNESLTTPDES